MMRLAMEQADMAYEEPIGSRASSVGGGDNNDFLQPGDFVSRHSDFTLVTDNRHHRQSPPLFVDSATALAHQDSTASDSTSSRRAIFGSSVNRRYATEASHWMPPPHPADCSSAFGDTVSPLASPVPSIRQLNGVEHGGPPLLSRTKKQQRVHETLHAQSLLLGLAFCAVWTPSNLMAPNLTQMAESFGLVTAEERDLYLGSYCALATGVLSFPISAGIGFLTDLYSRQRLFVLTVAGGALAAAATGAVQHYWQLFLLRLVNGGFMAASVPVAFSFLGDLFAAEERNAASSGLTAMMGLGIIAGQVYAGMVGVQKGWPHAFYVSAILTMVLAILCLIFIQEPERGGKEKVLQDMIKAGTRYERKLTLKGFVHAMRHNRSNSILLWQGFFSSLPWGIIFVFLNDYLSQERGFSVPDATFLVFLFGLGCTLGGVLGGYWGQLVQARNRSYLPLFMAFSTALGILPFVGLLNTSFTNAHGYLGFLFSVGGGLIASLPSVNVRPILINVNPPETRGAALTAANLLIQLGRGVGPSCVTLLQSIFSINRQCAFNVTLISFWLISALQLCFLSKTLPFDEDAMEADLEAYAMQALAQSGDRAQRAPSAMDDSLVSIEDYREAFDVTAARQTLLYVSEGIKELGYEMAGNRFIHCSPCCGTDSSSSEEGDIDSVVDGTGNGDNTKARQEIWRRQQQSAFERLHDELPDETTPLVI